jgi:hypothetical protein
MARTQLVYTAAIEAGAMDFGLFGSSDLPKKTDHPDKASLIRLLNDANDQWLVAIGENKAEDAVRCF